MLDPAWRWYLFPGCMVPVCIVCCWRACIWRWMRVVCGCVIAVEVGTGCHAAHWVAGCNGCWCGLWCCCCQCGYLVMAAVEVLALCVVGGCLAGLCRMVVAGSRSEVRL
eukprot:6475164-Amphidinium_carterae.1